MDATNSNLARLESLLACEPSNSELLERTVTIALQLGAVDRSESIVDSALRAAPDHARFRKLMATVRVAQKRLAEAHSILDTLVKDGVDDVEVLHSHACIAYRLGHFEQAACAFERILARREALPENTLAGLLRSRHRLGQVDRAIEAWEKASPLARDPEAHGIAGLLYLEAGKPALARPLAESAMLQTRPSLEALLSRGCIALGDGDADAAIPLLERALGRHPDDARVWSALATALLMCTDIHGALDAFEYANCLAPMDGRTLYGVAWCRLVSGDFEGARERLLLLLGSPRAQAATYGGLAVSTVLTGDRAEAHQWAQMSLDLDAQDIAAALAMDVLGGHSLDAVRLHHTAVAALRRSIAVPH